MRKRINPTQEHEQYLAVLVEVNPDKSGTAIMEMMREAFGLKFSRKAIQKRVSNIRGPIRNAQTIEQLADFFAFVASNSGLSFREIAEKYQALTGIEMNGRRAHWWYQKYLKMASGRKTPTDGRAI